MSSALYSLGRRCLRSRRLVIGSWLLVLVGLAAVAGLTNVGLDKDVTIPGTESQTALDSLSKTFPTMGGTQAQIVVLAADGDRVDSQAYRVAVASAVKELERTPQVAQVVSPFDKSVPGSVDEADDAAIITVLFPVGSSDVTGTTQDQLRSISAELETALPEGARTSLGGQLFSVVLPSTSIAEFAGLGIALIVLLLTLGSLMAAGLPLLIAVLGVGVSTSLIFIATSLTDINSTTPVLGMMLGLAVGIDYSLFVISRHRELMKTGIDVEESVARAVATAGSAVVFAGMTVVVALLGLSVAGVPFLTKMGIAAAAGVAIAVLMALTLLPALLGAAGQRLAPRARTPRSRNPHKPSQHEGGRVDRFYAGWIRGATRFPLLTILAVVGVVALLAVPATSLRLALPDAGSLPQGNEARVTYDLISEHFGEGRNATLFVTGSIADSNDPVTLMKHLGQEIRGLDGVALVPLATPNQTADTGVVQIIPTGGPTSPETKDLVAELRSLHDHFKDEYGIDTSVTGQTAVAIDVASKLGGAVLPFALLVVGLCLVLLTMVFRSVWVPIKATLGYLLSVGAAFGVVSLVFEHGYLDGLLNVSKTGPIMAFTPIIVMGILFGLAMDYELFLVSRIREEYVHGGDWRAAITRGFLGSARVVTAAALIMFAVFASFVPEGDSGVKPMAVGLAVGVFVDAFMVRMTLVPAVLALLKQNAWWMPRWLDKRLPRFDVEGEALAQELALRDDPVPDELGASR